MLVRSVHESRVLRGACSRRLCSVASLKVVPRSLRVAKRSCQQQRVAAAQSRPRRRICFPVARASVSRVQKQKLSTQAGSSPAGHGHEPVEESKLEEQETVQIDREVFELCSRGPEVFSEDVVDRIAKGLQEDGFVVLDKLLGDHIANCFRSDAESMLARGEMERSYSIEDNDGNESIIYKKGVMSRELNGDEWESAASMLAYTKAVLPHLPHTLNKRIPELCLSEGVYGTKLAVATEEGYYPKHVDNLGLPDTRKVTLVYYFNPDWQPGDGGELRIWKGPPDPLVEEQTLKAAATSGGANSGVELISEPAEVGNADVLTIAPRHDRLAVFWSDLVVHDVMPAHNNKHRWSLTLWLVSQMTSQISPRRHPLFAVLRSHFGNA